LPKQKEFSTSWMGRTTIDVRVKGLIIVEGPSAVFVQPDRLAGPVGPT
jgi:hypothetical protein